MSDLTITFTLSPAMIGAALFYDAVLLWLGVRVYRRLRTGRGGAPALQG